jgi:hypothetical protein
VPSRAPIQRFTGARAVQAFATSPGSAMQKDCKTNDATRCGTTRFSVNQDVSFRHCGEAGRLARPPEQDLFVDSCLRGRELQSHLEHTAIEGSRRHREAALAEDAYHRPILGEHKRMKGTQTIGTRDRRQMPQEDGADPDSLVSVFHRERAEVPWNALFATTATLINCRCARPSLVKELDPGTRLLAARRAPRPRLHCAPATRLRSAQSRTATRSRACTASRKPLATTTYRTPVAMASATPGCKVIRGKTSSARTKLAARER